ncbi:MAG: hypothetical protein JW827_12085 [Spirochaetes bacterium]|nr:hypothetical protein [Spirochaetota bacterium]
MTKRSIYFILLILFFAVPAFSQTTNTNVRLTSSEARLIYINSTISNFSKKNLEDICRRLGISSKGTKQQIIERIRTFLELEKGESIPEMIEKKKDLTDVIILESAHESEYFKLEDPEQEILTATGDVHLVYNRMRLRADKMKLNSKTKEMLCEGDVILFDGSKEITGDKIFYNLDTEYGVIYQGKSKIGQIIYRGEKIKKGEEGLYVIDRGQFTSCDEEPPHFYIRARKIWVYPNDKLVLVDAYYEIAGVKTCWIPVYFRFEKGTGIVTSWGRRRIEGWYMQNTYRFRLSDDDQGNLKFDHYQKRGEYLGSDYHYSTKDSEVIASAGGAYDKKLFGDSNINPDTGEGEREYRGKVSFKNRYTFNRDKENENFNTTIRGNLFWMSDYSFIQDFELYRSTIPGFHYDEDPIIYNDLYNQQENDWYIHITDNRKNSSLNIKTKWHFQWNPVIENWKITDTDLPDISYSLSGTVWEPPSYTESTNTASSNSTGFRIYPNLRYSFGIQFYHKDYYDITSGDFLKSVNYRRATFDLSRSFSLWNILQYRPSIGIGDVAYWPYDVDEQEKQNYDKQSYSYGNLSETLQMGPSSFHLGANHNLQWRFTEPPAEDEYGKIVAHSLGLYQRTAFISGVTYYANTSYDMRVKKNESLKGIERERFSDLNNQLNVSAVKNITLSERYVYSIRHLKPLTSNLSFAYNLSDFYLPYMEKGESFSASAGWNHNYSNPRASSLNINFGLGIKVSKNWRVNLSTHHVNEKLYLYSKELAEKYQVEVTENNAGEYEHRNFFVDLLNSINIFEPSKRKRSYFKLRSANISVTHDLHCWEMSFGYTLQQRYMNYGAVTQYPYFEHSFYLKINMRFETQVGINEQIRTEPPTLID